MSGTLYMFDGRTIQKSRTVQPATIRERFEAFHAANPQVFTRLREMAFQRYNAGHEQCGMKRLFEVMRWEDGLKTTGDTFKLNNDFTACYARKLMEHETELDGFFETRGT